MLEEESLVAPKTLSERCCCHDFTDLEHAGGSPGTTGSAWLIESPNFKESSVSWDCISVQLFEEAAVAIGLW